jgi:hypothetical protein
LDDFPAFSTFSKLFPKMAKQKLTIMSHVATRACPWRENFPEVFAFSNITPLTNHPLYESAKYGAVSLDAAGAARSAADADRLVADLFEIGDTKGRRARMAEIAAKFPGAVLVPLAAPPQGNGKCGGDGVPCRNYLAEAFARNVGKATGLSVCEDIFSMRYTSRTGKNAFFRFSLDDKPIFWGKVAAGTKYILADDVCNCGGSLNALRIFIEQNGGEVVACAALACQRNGDIYRKGTNCSTISLSPRTRGTILQRIGAERAGAFLRLTNLYGGDVDTLTDSEGQQLLHWFSESDGEFHPTEDDDGKGAKRPRAKTPLPDADAPAEILPAKVKAGILSPLLGVPPQHLSRLAAQGRVVKAHGTGGYYSLAPSILAYCDFLRAPASTIGTPQERELSARARITEAKAAQLENTLIGLDTAQTIFGEILTSVKNTLVSLPAQVEPELQARLKNTIHDTLNELADNAITLRDRLVDDNRRTLETPASNDDKSVGGGAQVGANRKRGTARTLEE